MNANETPILRTFKCVHYKASQLNHIIVIAMKSNHPTKDDPLSSSKFSIISKGTPNVIHLYP